MTFPNEAPFPVGPTRWSSVRRLLLSIHELDLHRHSQRFEGCGHSALGRHGTRDVSHGQRCMGGHPLRTVSNHDGKSQLLGWWSSSMKDKKTGIYQWECLKMSWFPIPWKGSHFWIKKNRQFWVFLIFRHWVSHVSFAWNDPTASSRPLPDLAAGWLQIITFATGQFHNAVQGAVAEIASNKWHHKWWIYIDIWGVCSDY